MVTRFETTDLYKQLYKESLGKNELSPTDLLIHTLAASFLETGLPPSSSRKEDWAEEGDRRAFGLNQSARIKMYKEARRLALHEPIAQAVLRKFIVHTCANGPDVTLASPNATLEKRLDALFPDFGQLARHILARTLIHGEYYVLHFPLDSKKWGYHPQLRPIIPDHCTKILLDDEWADTPIIKGYEFKLLRQKIKSELGKGILPTDNVTRFIIHQELNDSLHGLSLFYTLMKELPRYIDWLDSRQLRAKTDALFLIIRYLKGASHGETSELPERPMIIDAHKDHEEWKPLTTAGGGRDVAADGYEFRLRVAQGVGLPEHDVSGNVKFAGQVGRGVFPTRLYEYYQSVFGGFLRSMVAKTIGTNANKIVIHWPLVDTRDRTQLVSELRSLAGERIISRAEVHRRLGYEHERIEQELQRELEEAGLPAPGGIPTDRLTELLEMPQTPEPVTKEPATEEPTEPIVDVVLPSAKSAISFSLGLSNDNIKNEIPKLVRVGLGFDYGYADKGAGVIGGFTPDGNFAIVGESQLIRAKLLKWVDVANQVKEQYPELEAVWTGSDRPELVDALKEAGFTVIPQYLEKQPTLHSLKAFLEDHSLSIHPDCQQVIAALIPEIKEIQTQMHSKPAQHHFDAFAYLLLGMLETKGADDE